MERPRLLFIAFYFPPAQWVAAVRTWNIAAQLTRLGWEVTVLTPTGESWGNPFGAAQTRRRCEEEGISLCEASAWAPHFWTWRRTDSEATSAVLAAGRVALQLASIEVESVWMPSAKRMATRFSPGSFDLVMATGGPYSSFVLARWLSERLGVPYVLDYRDPWHTNLTRAIRPWRGRALEGRLVAGASRVIAVTPSLGRSIDSSLPVRSSTELVTNGWNPSELESVEPTAFDHFAIAYTGRFYLPWLTATPLMRTLASLERIRPDSPWTFHYYGPTSEHIDALTARFGLEHRVVNHGLVPREDALAALKGANAAFVVASEASEVHDFSRMFVPGKMYEAIGVGIPTILIAPPTSDVEWVGETAGGMARFAASEPLAAARTLSDWMDGKVPARIHPELFSWPVIADKLDRILRAEIEVGSDR